MATPAPATFAKLLQDAVNEPGSISSAYSAFHNYSLGNQLLAWGQCLARGIQPGPMATYQRWRELGRYVRRGEKAITLCIPVTVKRTSEDDGGQPEEVAFIKFVHRPNWFVSAQTDGQPLSTPPMPEWDKDRALVALNVQETGFDALNGNVMGYARERAIAINPLNPMPWKTRFHELAHVLLGHTSEGQHSEPQRTSTCESMPFGRLIAERTGTTCHHESKTWRRPTIR